MTDINYGSLLILQLAVSPSSGLASSFIYDNAVIALFMIEGSLCQSQKEGSDEAWIVDNRMKVGHESQPNQDLW